MPPIRFAHSAIRAGASRLPVLNPTKMADAALVVSFCLDAMDHAFNVDRRLVATRTEDAIGHPDGMLRIDELAVNAKAITQRLCRWASRARQSRLWASLVRGRDHA